MRWRTAEFLNSRNTEVFAEYGADEKVRQAYTYGENGIGERISVDKSEESSFGGAVSGGVGAATGSLASSTASSALKRAIESIPCQTLSDILFPVRD